MSWKCYNCDTYNEDGSRKCFVCGNARSAESIERGKIRARKERRSHLMAGLTKTVEYLTGTYVIIMSLSLILAVIALIVKIWNDGIGDIVQIFGMLTDRVDQNFNGAIMDNAENILSHIYSVLYDAGKTVAENMEALWSIVINNINSVR